MKLTNLLAIETSTHEGSVALQIEGNISQIVFSGSREHSLKLLPNIQHLLTENRCELAEIDALVLGTGPGSFTGIRLAASVVQGLAFGAQKPVYPICSLEALAFQAANTEAFKKNPKPILVAMDARMQEMYWNIYHFVKGELKANQAVKVTETAGIAAEVNQPVWLVGDAHEIFSEQFKPFKESVAVLSQLKQASAQDLINYANHLIQAGQTNPIPAEKALPYYVRDQVTNK